MVRVQSSMKHTTRAILYLESHTWTHKTSRALKKENGNGHSLSAETPFQNFLQNLMNIRAAQFKRNASSPSQRFTIYSYHKTVLCNNHCSNPSNMQRRNLHNGAPSLFRWLSASRNARNNLRTLGIGKGSSNGVAPAFVTMFRPT